MLCWQLCCVDGSAQVPLAVRAVCTQHYDLQGAEEGKQGWVRLEGRLTAIRNRMDSAYADRLDGKIPEDFWGRKMSDWRMEEQQVKIAIVGLDTQISHKRSTG